MNLNRLSTGAIASALVLALSSCGGVSRGGDDAASGTPGVTDDEIVLGLSLAQSGPLSVYGNFSDAMNAYFNHINETEGGVDGRKIKLITYDDAFEPSRTLENVRRLVEQDDVFAITGVVGTQPNLGIIDYSTQNKIPTIFLGAGTAALGDDPEAHPYTVPFLPPYPIEGEIVARHLAATDPDAKVAFLARDDDGGTDWLKGFERGIEGTDIEIVAEEFADVNAATVDSQMVNLAASKADVFLNINNPKQASQAIEFIAGSSWSPQQYVASYASSIESTLKPAGLDNATGLLSTQYMKDPSDSTWDGDEEVEQYKQVIAEYAPKVNVNDVNTVVSGYTAGQMTVEALKAMDEPTREGLMDAVHGMTDVEIDMLLPGITVDLAEDDHYVLECLQMQEFNGKSYDLTGDVICADD